MGSSDAKAWIFLGIAGLLEVAWALGLKCSEGFTRPLASVLTVAGMIVSFLCLSYALKSVPVSVGYAVWTGIGTVGTALAGILWLKEPASFLRAASIVLIVAGIAGVKIFK
ncbi:MAG TPA: multidrug efflux SMR transporter [Verrucomicrobiae bacterium]|nr:multidrug efflux SMR transporter [Verrucomicrobiae bacterium]